MATLTGEEVTSMLGPVDDAVVAEIIGMGASSSELAEALAWIANDEALMNAGRPLAGGRVARLVEIIAELEEAEERLSQAGSE